MARKGVDFDVIIGGSGPAGLFAALELTKLCPDKKVAIFEKGPDREERTEDNVTSGLGGAGAFSDGKLILPNSRYPYSLKVGGHLASIIGEKRFLELVEHVDQIYTEFGGHQEIYEKDEAKIKELVEKASAFDLRLVPTRTRHFGTDRAPEIVKAIAKELRNRGVEIYLESPIKSIRKEGNRFLVKVTGKTAGIFKSRYVIAAPGRDGADWLAGQAKKLDLVLPQQTTVDIGVRVEVRDFILKPITDYIYDPKFIIKKTECAGDWVRTFCTCPNGHVIVEKYRGLLTSVNGHSYERDPSQKSENTNFAILVSIKFDEPFREPLIFGQRISELANLLSGKVMVQRLGDLTAAEERRSRPERIAEISDLIIPTLKEAYPGDIGFVIPYRFMRDILEMIEKLDKIAPGVNSKHTLIYIPEVKFYSSKIETTEDLETAVEGFFVAGDGPGISRGILQSSGSGIVVAQAIAQKEIEI